MKIQTVSRVCKVDSAKRVVYGPVLVPGEVDLQNEVVSEDEIFAAAHWYLVNTRKTGVQHGKSKPGIDGEILSPGNGKLELVESYVTPVDFTLGAQFLPAGTWVVGMHVIDDVIWADVLSGKLAGFSMNGLAYKTPVGE